MRQTISPAARRPAGLKVPSVIHYRGFHNDDPPALIETWNDAFTGRGAVKFISPSPLESYIFSKLYFDRAGLIVAEDDGRPVGFAHAGFGPNADGSRLDPSTGVLCVVGVRASHQRRGIGSELLRRCEDYLRGRGATVLHAGSRPPLTPFYLGLYGGSNLPGFLASDPAAEPFLKRHGYEPADVTLVWQRRLDRPLAVGDSRFATLRRRYELDACPRTGRASWYQENVLGPVELLEFRLKDKSSEEVVAQADVFEMEGYRWRWGEPVAGVYRLEVHEGLRRQGLAKLLLVHLMRQLNEQYFTLVEVQTPETNEPAAKLLRSLGFEPVDRGRTYRKESVSGEVK